MLPTKGVPPEDLEEFKKKAASLGFTITPVDEAAEKKKAASKGKASVKDDEEHNPLRGSGFYERKEVSFTKKFGDTYAGSIMVREFSDADIEGAVIVTGFPSTSLASILTGGYLREQLKLPLVGVISSAGFPPRCIIERGIPSHSVRIFGDRRLVVILCEFKIPSNELIHTLSVALIDYAERHKSPMILTVEGMPTSEKEEDHLHFISTDKDLSDTLIQDDHIPLEEAVVGGVTGALLAEGVLNPTTGVSCLLTPTSQAFPDASSAVTVVKVVTQYVSSLGHHKLEIDTAPLENKASDLHSTIQNLFENEKQNSRASDSLYS